MSSAPYIFSKLVRSLVNYWRGLGRRVLTFWTTVLAGTPITLVAWSIVFYVGLIWTLQVSLWTFKNQCGTNWDLEERINIIQVHWSEQKVNSTVNASNGHVDYHRNEQFGTKESLGRLIDGFTHIIKGWKEREHKLYKKNWHFFKFCYYVDFYQKLRHTVVSAL